MNSVLVKLGNFFFIYRSYIPIPFLLICIIFMEPVPASLITGFLISVCGELIRLWSVSYAGSETRTTTSVGGSQLITKGPYTFVRNPIYVGNILIYTGIGIMSNAFFPFLQIIGLLFFVFQYYCIVLREEEFLREKFGDVYESFFNSVNRFIPSYSGASIDSGSIQSFDIKKGIISERRSLQAFLISAIIIFAGYLIRLYS